MRHAVPSGGLLSGAVLLSGAAAVPLVLAVLGAPAARTAPDRAAALSDARSASGRTAAAPRVVRYRGLRVPVPAGWQVHDLDRDPARCVRYDRHALYLGLPGPQPDCPARIVGRTEAVHIQPADRAAGDGRLTGTVVHARQLATLTLARSVDHEARLALPEAGVTITGVYGTDPAALQRLLRGTRVTGSDRPAGPSPAPPPDVRRERTPGAGSAPTLDRPWTKGKGFDTCSAPSLPAMKAWRRAFKVTNIYIGGAARGCAQPNLTSSWLSAVRSMGYRVTPTYVGLQAPCGTRPQRFTARNAAVEGRSAAVDAARRARDLGIPEGAPIYYDMEAYKHGRPACRAAVLRFVDNWVRRLRAEGYVPCLYGSVKSAIRDVSRATGIRRPAAVWFANWDGNPSVYGDPFMPGDLWRPHRRVKQYRGGHRERHGGVSLNIDSDMVDGRVH
ncbi:glycoside hydrolase domain-containing protein [Actinomadura decatromicini]|uniref:DUF1906 domain-containing protein n=1 Tax=Actinomadura decatromicini TaxID=2604572 RepID=A0A5D3FJR0_9ACTN|nr:glycoside hydrolase domain-containing protein [Actinomadura decatromicini]TYK48136.1 DUF1906 domain-containing protein [Actinomadura decatromicini]